MSISTEKQGLAGPARAYLYLVALVAIHMAVLGIANLLRIAAEVALHASSGGFTGLPFVFVDYNQPQRIYLQQLSLALALALVGGAGWAIHWGLAERAARRAPAERGAGMRSVYLTLVQLVTALLVFAYGVAVISGLVSGLLGQPLATYSQEPTLHWNPGFGADFLAGMAGQLSMVIAAGAVLVYHLRVGWTDRQAVPVGGEAAGLRRLRVYLLSAIGLGSFAFSLAAVLSSLWRSQFPETSSSFDLLGSLIYALPFAVAGLPLWLANWFPAQRLAGGSGFEADAERESTLRRVLLYGVVLVSGAAALIALAGALSDLVRRLLGDNSGTGILPGAGPPLAYIAVFGAAWWLHRRAIERDASLQVRVETGATLRRLYYYAVCALSMAIIAVGAAGLVGVVGSRFITGHDNHPPAETAFYITLLLVGIPAWAWHWRAVVRRVRAAGERAPDELRALARRGYLYLAAFGGVATLLVAGSAVAFRIFNGLLLGGFGIDDWHTIWHLSVDAAVGLAVFAVHLRVVQADRAALARSAGAAAEELEQRVTVLVRAATPAAAEQRIERALRSAKGIRLEPAASFGSGPERRPETPAEQGEDVEGPDQNQQVAVADQQ
jgi:hypothetical protein